MSDAQLNAVALVEAAYEDCASLCDIAAEKALPELASINFDQAIVLKMAFESIAEIFRDKKMRARQSLALGLADLGAEQ